MFKRMLVAVAVLSLSQQAMANKAEIWNCVDNATLNADQQCVAKTIAKNTETEFFAQLANKEFTPTRDAFATITLFPERNLIEVKSLEGNSIAKATANQKAEPLNQSMDSTAASLLAANR